MQRILLLEDQPRLADMVVRALQGVGIACDGFERMEAAAHALRSTPYAAAIIDRGLPDGDGLALVKRMRQQGDATPCLVLTARDALHDRLEGLESGADDYLCKPFSMAELVARVRALMRRPVAMAPANPEFGCVQLSLSLALLCCGDEQITLARAEVQIMASLIQAQGLPVRRSTLELAAWGLTEAVTPNALDVALHRLRKKLDALGAHVGIINLRGVGYALQLVPPLSVT